MGKLQRSVNAALARWRARQSKPRINMPPIDEWDRRLLNWALDMNSGGTHGSGYINPVYSLQGRGRRDYQCQMPILAAEAAVTGQLVQQLEPHVQAVLRVWYGGRGSREQQAEDAQCVDRFEMYRIVQRAKVELDSLESARHKRFG
jgi:hypothetical protein